MSDGTSLAMGLLILASAVFVIYFSWKTLEFVLVAVKLYRQILEELKLVNTHLVKLTQTLKDSIPP